MAIRSFMPFAYVVYLQGNNVAGGILHLCLMENFSELDDARKALKERYNLEFTKHCIRFFGTGHQEFNNITDDRDITLVVERVEILNVKHN